MDEHERHLSKTYKILPTPNMWTVVHAENKINIFILLIEEICNSVVILLYTNHSEPEWGQMSGYRSDAQKA